MPPRHLENHPLYLYSSIHKRRFSMTPGKATRRVPAYMLCFVTKGDGVLLMDNSVHHVEPFELFFLLPGMVIEASSLSASIEYYAILFEPVTVTKTNRRLSISELASFPKALTPGRLPIRNTQQAYQRFLRLYADSRGTSGLHSFALRLQFEVLIYELMWDLSLEDKSRDVRIDRSIAYMQQYYAEKIDLPRLSKEADLTPGAYSRLFRSITGALPLEYLTKVRIERAKQLLMQEDSRVKEVAASVGFQSEFYFSRIFHRVVNVSPSIYMNRRKLKIAVASSLGFQDNLAALGIQPVSIVDLYKYPWMSDEEYNQLSLMQMDLLKDSRPDLIIGDHYHQAFQEQFKQLAPHVILRTPDRNWRDNHLKLADLVDRQREAEQAINRLELRSADVRRALSSSLGNERITVIQVTHLNIGIQGTANHPLNELLYAELGLKPGKLVSTDNWRLELQPEALPSLETEHLFIQKHHLLAGSEKIFERMVGTQSWNTNDAVKNNNVRLIPNWFLMSWTPNGRNQIMDALIALS